MISTTIDVPTPDGAAEAYMTSPGDGVHPGVLMYMDAIGLRPQIRAMAERVAGWGYVVLSPNVFYRDASAADLEPTGDLRDPGEREIHIGRVMELVGHHTPERAARDAAAYVAALRGLEGVAAGGIAAIGYCMGGGLALRTAAQLPDEIAAVATFHAGRLVTDAPDSVHHLVKQIHAEVYVGHADNDPSMPPEAITELEAALTDAGLSFTSEVYAGAPHGFTMSDTSAYDEQAAETHFKILETLLTRTLR
ncbi:MAG: hypothetical protein JWO02_3460 [Solirubrobacterales bacterium]|nr:hypothetical protein [Solirubrobacterales bacterium]